MSTDHCERELHNVLSGSYKCEAKILAWAIGGGPSKTDCGARERTTKRVAPLPRSQGFRVGRAKMLEQ